MCMIIDGFIKCVDVVLVICRHAEPSYKAIEWERDAEIREHYLSILTEFPDMFEAKYRPSRQMQRAKKKFLETIGSRGPTTATTAEMHAETLANTTARGNRLDYGYYEHRKDVEFINHAHPLDSHDAHVDANSDHANAAPPRYINFNDYSRMSRNMDELADEEVINSGRRSQKHVHMSLAGADADELEDSYDAKYFGSNPAVVAEDPPVTNKNSGRKGQRGARDSVMIAHQRLDQRHPSPKSTNSYANPEYDQVGASSQPHDLFYSTKLGEGSAVDHTFRTPRGYELNVDTNV
jgi:hypothetical protein